MKLFFFTTILLWGVFSQQGFSQTYVDYYNQSIEAYKSEDYKRFLQAIRKADSLRPNHPVILYNLANGYTFNNEYQKAVETLRYRSHFYAARDFNQDEDLKVLKGEKEWADLVENLNEWNEPYCESELVFEFSKPGFHPEGVSYNKEKGELYFSDVHKGMIYKSDVKKGELIPLIDLKDHGYWSALGVKVDPLNADHLWVTTTALPNFMNFREKDEGKSAVLLFNIHTGDLLKAYQTNDGYRNFGEISITKKGTVYVTDSGPDPIIFRIDKQDGVLVENFTHEQWWNLQGLAESENGKWLYVSDYVTGIYKIDLHTKQIDPVLKENEWLRGGDGIYLKDNKLIVLQNGSLPKRVATIELDWQGLGKLETLRFPHQADKNLEEPTMGAWVEDDFYYIGNSPWGYYDENYRAKEDEWPSLLVYRLTLN